MTWVRQQSFARGELSAGFHGRDDLRAVYDRGLRKARNGRIDRSGAFESRPGSTIVDTIVADADSWAFVPFRYSDEDQLQLLAVRVEGVLVWYVLHNGAVVTTFGRPEASWDALDLTKLRYTQSGNIVSFTHRDGKPYDLVRISDIEWEWLPADYSIPGWDFDGEPALVHPLPTIDATHPSAEWRIFATLVLRRLDGSGYDETEPEEADILLTAGGSWGASSWAPLPTNEHAPSKGQPILIDCSLQAAAYSGWSAAWKAKWAYDRINFYAGRGSGGNALLGFIGSIRVATATVPKTNLLRWYGEEAGSAPQYTLPPPRGFNPFRILNENGVPIRTEFPIANAYFDQRYILAGTSQRPGHLWASAVDSFLNLDRTDDADLRPRLASDAIHLVMAQYQHEEMRALVALDRLLVFTNSGVYAVNGAQGPLSATDLNLIQLQTGIGASWLQPLVVPRAVVYVGSRGEGLRALSYSNEAQGYQDFDLSFFARDLVEGYSFSSWCWQDREGFLNAVRSDGKYLTISYSQEQQVLAYTLNDTPGGQVKALGSILEGGQDAVYAVVVRGDTVCIERWAARRVTDVADAVCVDSARVYEGAATNEVSGLAHLEGLEVWANARGSVSGPHTVVDGKITIPGPPQTKIIAGLLFRPLMELLDVGSGETRARSLVCKEVEVEWEASRGIFGSETEDSDAFELRRLDANVGVASAWAAPPLTTGTGRVQISGRYGKGGRCVISQRLPLPMRVLAISRNLAAGGAE